MACVGDTQKKCHFGVFGMGTMGQNLALNVASRGFVVAAYNRPDEFQVRERMKE
jgi:6-phosphogluconate dehydrogenase